MCVNLWFLVMHKHIVHKIVPFVLTFMISVFLAEALPSFLNWEDSAGVQQSPNGFGSARGIESGSFPGATGTTVRGPNSPLRITFQPKAIYTDEARMENVQGAVRLKITLLSDGTVGNITPVSELPLGLTEMAIKAARKIKFEPKMVNNEPVSVIITREYTFTIY
jgi:TonB family protein